MYLWMYLGMVQMWLLPDYKIYQILFENLFKVGTLGTLSTLIIHPEKLFCLK